MKRMKSSDKKEVINKNQLTSLSPYPCDKSQKQSPDQKNSIQNEFEINKPDENKSLLKQKEYQSWLRKRYRVRANINYLWHAHQLYDKQQLEELFETVKENSPDIYKFNMKQEEQNNQEQEINLEAFYHVMKKLGKDNFMDRNAFNNIIRLIDRDGNRKLNKNEFYTMLMSRTINQQIFQLNQESWKKSNSKQFNPEKNEITKRHRFASADSYTKQKNNNEKQPNIQQKFNFLPSLISSKNTDKQPQIQRKYQSSCTTPSNKNKNAQIMTPRFKDEQLNNSDYHNNSQEMNNFSQIDLTKMIGKLKYENDRSKLLQNFEEVRNNKFVDIEEKCDKLNQIIKQKHFNVDNIGISPTQKLLSRQKIQEIRKGVASPSPLSVKNVSNTKNQSKIDLFEGSIFVSEPNIGVQNSNQESISFLPSINNIRTHPLTIENSTNFGSNVDDISTNDKNSLNMLHPNSIGKRFQFVKHLSEINFDEQNYDSKVQDPLDMIDDKLYNNNLYTNIKHKANTYSVRRNLSKKDSFLTSGLNSKQNSQIYQSLDLNDDQDTYRKNLYQKQTLEIGNQIDKIDDDISNDEEDDDEQFQFNKRELGMIVERAKYKGKKQAEILTANQINMDNSLVKGANKDIQQFNLKEISNTAKVYSQYPRNIRKTYKQNSFSNPSQQKETKNDSNSSRGSSLKRNLQIQQNEKNKILQIEKKQSKIISNDSSFIFLKINNNN